MTHRTLIVITLAGLLSAQASTRAAGIVDTEKTMSWDDLVACKLVVAGTFANSKAGTLGIDVQWVLKQPPTLPGNAHEIPVKIGDVLALKCEHWWSIQNGPVGLCTVFPGVLSDNSVTHICYKQAVNNPAELVPMPMLDGGQTAIFFFPDAQCVLKRPLQILPYEQLKGWQAAVNHQPMDLLDRLAQRVDPAVSAQAIDELKTRRDPRVIARLIQAAPLDPGDQDPATHGLFDSDQPTRYLVALGDRHGDVYNPTLVALTKMASSSVTWDSMLGEDRLCVVLTAADQERALAQYRLWIDRPPDHTTLSEVGVHGLGTIANERALDLAISLMSDTNSDIANPAVGAVVNIVTGQSCPWFLVPEDRRSELWQYAKPRLLKLPPPAHLRDDAQVSYQWLRDRAAADSKDLH